MAGSGKKSWSTAPPRRSFDPCAPLLPCHSLSNNEDKFFTDWEETFDSFDQMGLHENLLRGIYAYGASLPPSPG